MSLAASPPPAPLPTSNYDQLNQSLDEDIQNIRAEIQNLTSRRKVITATLLSSTRLQSHIRQQQSSSAAVTDVPPELASLLHRASEHNQSNIHRLAFGITAFPFNDPNPAGTDDALVDPRLLGIRLEIPCRDGTYKAPHYILCRRVGADGVKLRVHRHTIPSFIPLKDYEDDFLPVAAEEEENNGDDTTMDEATEGDEAGPKQDLHGFVRRVRRDLIGWNSRVEAIQFVAEQLGLSPSSDEKTRKKQKRTGSKSLPDSCGVHRFEAVGVDARYARIEWQDGRVGRVKICDKGYVERAVVFGDEGRLKHIERVLSDGGTVQIQDLATRLRMVEEQDNEMEDS